MKHSFFMRTAERMALYIIGAMPSDLRSRLFRGVLKSILDSREGTFKQILSTEMALGGLSQKGFSPSRIIDCGAYRGHWGIMAHKIFPMAKILMIEADPDNECSLSAVKAKCPENFDYVISLLGARPMPAVEFYKMGTGSSVFEERSNAPRQVLFIPMRTLDSVAIEKNFIHASLLKLDVQGNELGILRGASALLSNVECVLLEASFLQYNKGAPLFGEVVRFMAERGFVLFDIGALVRWAKDNSLLQGDFLFVREDSALRPDFFEFS